MAKLPFSKGKFNCFPACCLSLPKAQLWSLIREKVELVLTNRTPPRVAREMTHVLRSLLAPQQLPEASHLLTSDPGTHTLKLECRSLHGFQSSAGRKWFCLLV